jgi:hypothetical protein
LLPQAVVPAAKVYLVAANVYLQDELRGAHKVELSPLKESGGVCRAAATFRPQSTMLPAHLQPRERISLASPILNAFQMTKKWAEFPCHLCEQCQSD